MIKKKWMLLIFPFQIEVGHRVCTPFPRKTDHRLPCLELCSTEKPEMWALYPQGS